MRLAAPWTDSYPVAEFWFIWSDKLGFPEYPAVYITLALMDPLIPLFVRDDQVESFDLEQEIADLASEVGWVNVLKEAFHVLARPGKKDHWYKAASVLYWAVSDGIALPYPVSESTAQLYFCLEQHPGLGQHGLSDGENLVWSIASKLNGVSYESDWKPLHEPSVLEAMSRLRK